MKEVVHVPTLELVEKVLKVAKENGFKTPKYPVEYYFKVFGCKTCFRIEKNDFRAATKDFYENEGHKVITTEEFLNRYKTKFKPIAMRCSREQFEAVRPKLEKLGKIGNLTNAFVEYNYLTNKYNEECNSFDFINESLSSFDLFKNNTHHDWNEAVFLEHCGYIEEEPTELEQLRKENAELKEQLKAVEDQPKVGDVCLFWDDKPSGAELTLYDSGTVREYDNCVKATPENIEKVI